MSGSTSAIDPSGIPGDDLDPDAVAAAATSLATGGANVRDSGANVLNEWRGLGSCYEAPESAQLFAVMDPVEAKSRELGDDVEHVAAALTGYASEIRPIKAALARVKSDAVAFRAKIVTNPQWQFDQVLVDENTDLVRRVDTQQVALWDAERTCANSIRALSGAKPWHPSTGANDPLGYMASTLGTDTKMAWGGEVQRKDSCPKSAAVSVKGFMWDGLACDGIGGMVTGLSALAGFNGGHYDWETMKSTWVGIYTLLGPAITPEGEKAKGDAWLALLKSVVSYSHWGDDPARAAGGAFFNVATFLIPVAGAAVDGAKGAATAGEVGRAAAIVGRVSEVVKFADPIVLATVGAKFLLPKLGDLLPGIRLATEGLHLPDLRVPEIEATAVGVEKLADTLPALHDLSGMPEHVAVTEAAEPARVLEHAGVGSGHAPELPGGLGRGADDLLHDSGSGAHPGAPGSSALPDAPSGGHSGGVDPAAHTDGAGSPAHTDGPGSPAHTDGSGSPAHADGSGSGSDGAGHTAADHGAPADGSGAGASQGGMPPGRVAIDDSGVPHVIHTSDDLLRQQAHFMKSLDASLVTHGLTKAKFVDLVTTPLERLTRVDVVTLLDIRDALPSLTPDDVLQKVISPDQALDALRDAAWRYMEPDLLTRAAGSPAHTLDSIGGFVARGGDAVGLSTKGLIDHLGLTYPKSPFAPTGESIFAVRYRAGDGLFEGASGVSARVDPLVPNGSLDAMKSMPDSIYAMTDDAAKRQAIKTWIDTTNPAASFDANRALDFDPNGHPNTGPRNPFRGNGFGGTGDAYAPEMTYGSKKINIPEGAELWRVRPDGMQDLAAVFRDDSWNVIAEQPLGAP